MKARTPGRTFARTRTALALCLTTALLGCGNEAKDGATSPNAGTAAGGADTPAVMDRVGSSGTGPAGGLGIAGSSPGGGSAGPTASGAGGSNGGGAAGTAAGASGTTATTGGAGSPDNGDAAGSSASDARGGSAGNLGSGGGAGNSGSGGSAGSLGSGGSAGNSGSGGSAGDLGSGGSAGTGGWRQLFNGQDLDGWVPKFAGSELGVNYLNTFQVVDGILIVSYDDYSTFDEEFGHLFYDEVFSSYVIRAEYRFVGSQVQDGVSWGLLNNGIMIHSQSPGSMTLAQQFPVSIEVKLFAQQGQTSGNVCTPGTDIRVDGNLTGNMHCMNTSRFSHGANEWVTIEVEVHGNTSVKHTQNGIVTAEYGEPQLDPNDPNEERAYARALLDAGSPRLLSEGYIAIQAETQPTEFRKIELLVLDQ